MVKQKRIFFGMRIFCPWADLQSKKLLALEDRHLTLSFLGNVNYEQFKQNLQIFPKPSFTISLTGFFNSLIFLPEKNPHVVAMNANLFNPELLKNYQRNLQTWLQMLGFTAHNHRLWIAHVTIAREPFDQEKWKEVFMPLPFACGDIILFESLGHSKYKQLWSYPLIQPFQEIQHVADIAFEIRGTNFLELYQNAFTALSFRFPPMTGMLSHRESFEGLDDVIAQLNIDFAIIDAKVGIPFKAISYHGDFQQGQYLMWKMVVDV